MKFIYLERTVGSNWPIGEGVFRNCHKQEELMSESLSC